MQNTIGPYKINGKKLAYSGNRLYKPVAEVRGVRPPVLSKRHLEIGRRGTKWPAIIKIWDGVQKSANEFMEKNGVLFFDLPIITRMISSPGALKGTIISDVDPFKIKFFSKDTFLTQSSQLYLEFAVANPNINKVYCWDKSFRRERADFRHLPEFAHIEFEGKIDFEDNLILQQNFVKFLIGHLVANYAKEMSVFIDAVELRGLETLCNIKNFARVTFYEAFKLLKEKTNDPKYDRASIENFSAYEEVLLTEIVGSPVFVTNYIGNEVAFYHAPLSKDPELVKNADLLLPGYGEIVGSGERVRTRKETMQKAKHFKLDMEDYRPYIESRDPHYPVVHSGWGMGIERFVQTVLKMPYIWDVKPFPRIDDQNAP